VLDALFVAVRLTPASVLAANPESVVELGRIGMAWETDCIRPIGGWVMSAVTGFVAALVLLLVALTLVGAGYGFAQLVTVAPAIPAAGPFLSGNEPTEHAVSRFHVRWYPLSMVYLAFEMEMLFMYPWTLVVAKVGAAAVIEMFVFLGILLAGVAYAWREGALRWV
jgi:NADH-quinone oxidoreductase subunit A